MRAFFNRKGITLSIREYVITALSYMALGLFSSLIIGVIIQTLGKVLQYAPLIEMGSFAMDAKVMGGAIGVAIAYGLKAPPLVMFAALFSGAFGAEMGGPAASYIAALFSIEFGKIVSGETKLDIIVTPFITILIGFMTGSIFGTYIQVFLSGFGDTIEWATNQRPFIMGVLVALLMGLALTAPISSVAIAIMLELDGLAAGAATIGCSAQMIGFAISSYRENGFGGLVAQGIGTSMLQIGNVIKNPLILLPPTISGMVLAPFSTVLFQLENNPAGAGMGTSGLVGQIMTFQTMGISWDTLWLIMSLHIISPALISLVLSELFRKQGWIKFGDMKLTLGEGGK
ncbi:PTS transporter subunit IIC [Salinibacillus xinjiangensis]|uniref:PTS sugar transporter subunit IIC n=1 Tax=Salinibacillus xinjiangensis TaxID=1229268 RepID=A0A6G1XAC6_9BACI|nr:PTS sugar transporter subunit IIC [Salinibacillus xinjiangensis]MRG87738.1 PTS sugar transporter subunit IIC [Salinibacillus xinjiangensis]